MANHGILKDLAVVMNIMGEKSSKVFNLMDGVNLTYGSEPDILFEKNGEYVVTIEVKGGKDPAGALKRLGAVQKSFEETPVQCHNF